MTWIEFENFVNNLLNLYGYNAINPHTKVVGRGTTHQIDAIGINHFVPTFSYPITIIAEAKYYKIRKSVGIDVVRNFYGVLTDIKQNQPKTYSIPKITGNQYINGVSNIIGLIISTSAFSSYAREFAYAHSIFLVTINFIKKNHFLCFGNFGGHPVIIQVPDKLNINPTKNEQESLIYKLKIYELIEEFKRIPKRRNYNITLLKLKFPLKGNVKKVTPLEYMNEQYAEDENVSNKIFTYKYEIYIPDFKSTLITITQNEISETNILLTIELPNLKSFLTFEIENTIQK